MGKRKWDQTGSKSRGSWRLRRVHCHPDVAVYVEYAGKGGRRNLPRYRVRVVGPVGTVVLTYSNGSERRWALGTAKQKGERIATYTFWLVTWGVVEGENDVN